MNEIERILTVVEDQIKLSRKLSDIISQQQYEIKLLQDTTISLRHDIRKIQGIKVS